MLCKDRYPNYHYFRSPSSHRAHYVIACGDRKHQDRRHTFVVLPAQPYVVLPTLPHVVLGLGIEEILEAIVHTLPAPDADASLPLRALIFDSYYDAYRGVVVFFRVVDGEVRRGDKIRFMNSGVEYEVLEVGVMTPVQVKVDVLR